MNDEEKSYRPLDFMEAWGKLLDRVSELESLVDKHYQTMGEQVGALDTRVRRLERIIAGRNTMDEYSRLIGGIQSELGIDWKKK